MIKYIGDDFNPSSVLSADIETSGLLHHLKEQGADAKLHNFGVKYVDGRELLFSANYSTLNLQPYQQVKPLSELQDFLNEGHTFAIHSGITFDLEALKMLGYDVSKCLVIDTLYLVWYLYPTRILFGLEAFGEEFGIPKPPIADWTTLTQSEYNHRVLQDTRIQCMLWKKVIKDLYRLYDNRKEDVIRLINHLQMKGYHLRNSQETKWKLDIPKAEILQDKLSADVEGRRHILTEVMPLNPIHKDRKRPSKSMYKLNGYLSTHGVNWLKDCLKFGIDFNLSEERIFDKYEVGNPDSPNQLKDWLFSLGWEPETFDYKRNEDGSERKIPQITIPKSGGMLDPDLWNMAKSNADLKELVGYGIVKNRLSVVKGWLESHQDGYVTAGAAGFTNTLRLRHRGLVNIPSTRVLYGAELRELLTCEEGEELLGSDLSGLEDRCKHHYQIPFDPEYVRTQLEDPSFDPHLAICLIAKLLTPQQVADHKAGVASYDNERSIGKTTNYGCQYGAGPPTLARQAKIPLSTAKEAWDAYWKLNYSIKLVSEDQITKTALGQTWLFNPVAKLWYHLKAKKDIFSTLCQGTGAYAFDLWVESIFEICQERWGREPLLCGQFHDEIILRVKKNTQHIWTGVVKEAIQRANQKLNMRREIDSDIGYDSVYSGIH